jgi:hypothetical protein
MIGARTTWLPDVPVIVHVVKSNESPDELVRVTIDEPVPEIDAGLITGTTSESHDPDSAICPLKPEDGVGVIV